MKFKLTTFLFLFLFAAGMNSINAQYGVTIGTDETPEKGALLQIKDKKAVADGTASSSSGGLLLPRVELQKRTELYPFFTEGATDYSGDSKTKAKKSLIGLVVYNIKEVEDATDGDLQIGFYTWDGEKWEMSEKAPDIAKVGDVDCGRAIVSGVYYKGSSLNSTHSVQLPVTFTSKGAYNLSIRTGNGYYFTKAGTVESAGTFTLKFEGLGTPSIDQTDQLNLYSNEELINISCTLPTITVKSPTINYFVNCGDAKVMGDYYVGEGVDESHYIEVPIVFDNYTSDAVIIKSNNINGVYFEFNGTVAEPANASDPVIIKLEAQGIPSKAGVFQYQFKTNGGNVVTCDFEVTVQSKLGTFAYPAKSCLAILNEDPTKVDGEYWVMKNAATDDDTPVKTFCDMSGGGYTLIWSYSERTAYTGGTIYTPVNNMEMTRAHQLNLDLPQNVVENSESGTINYNNYRLSKNTMVSVKGASLGKYRVQIGYDPKDMKDAWAKIMYMKIEPPRIAYDFINGGGDNQSLSSFKVDGILYGIRITADGTTLRFDGRTTSDSPGVYNGSYYATHFNFNYGFGAQSPTQYQWTVNLPKHKDDGGGTYSYTFDTRGFNNMFGWYGEYNGDHHFGKCGGASGNDYTINTAAGANTGCTGAAKAPHSFNSGQGRYFQWWVR